MSSQGEQQILPLSLGLEDGNDTNNQPRRFLKLPSGHLLAYGGDNGNVSCLLPEEIPASDHIDKRGVSEQNRFHIVQRYEDAIRCIAVSKDGKRLAIGFDTGKTQIHCFDEFVCQEKSSDMIGTKLLVHPYVQALKKAQTTEGNHDDDFLLSQDCNNDDNDLDYFAGPDLGAPARDMIFIPHKNCNNKASSSPDTYMLAIASEAGMFVTDVTNKEIMDGCDHWLEEESKESHDQCGIRGLDFGIFQTCSGNSNDSLKSKHEIIVLASLAMDGRLCLWDFTNKKLLQREDTLCVPKKDVGEIHDADAYDRSCRPIIFHPNKNSTQKLDLIIGTPGKLMPCTRILKFNDEDGKIKFRVDSTFDRPKDTENGHIQPIVTMMFCSDHLLITSGQDGRVLVWLGRHSNSGRESMNDYIDVKWEVVEKYQLGSPATDLCVQQYQSAGKISLFSACANGSLQVFDITKYHNRFKNECKKKFTSKITEVNHKNVFNDEKQTSHIVATDNSTTNSEVNSKRLSNNSETRNILENKSFSDNSDGDDDGDGDLITSSFRKPKNVHFLEESEENDVENFDEGKPKTAVSSRSRNRADSSGHYSDEEDGDSLLDHGLIPNRKRLIDVVKQQPAFSPSSTPLDLTRRFLCWNHIGSVTLLQGDKSRNIIDINFADSAFRRPISFTDNINFIIGSVGESGGIFASDIKDDDEYIDGDEIDGLDQFNMSERTKQAVIRDQRKRTKDSENSKPTGSSIFFYRFQTSSLVNRKNKDWHLILPDGERVLGAACGDGWAAAVTSRQFLRLFSPGGIQNQIVWLKGEPVTMVGRGGLLAVFYHESSPLVDKTQQLGYTLWDAADFRVISRGFVSCLSKGSSLSWVGFSNDLSLMVLDTDGMLSMLFTTGQGSSDGTFIWEWAPVLDTIGLRKSSDDCHWPVTVHNGKLVCIPLKGGNTYPDANRRPVTTTLGLRMPLAQSVVSKNSVLEELSVRSNIALSQKNFVRELDCDSDELEAEYVALSAQVDKVTLRLFSGMVDAGKLESAFDLVGRLHSEKSYDIAIRLADRQYKLADEVEKIKKFKFPDDDNDYDEDHTRNNFRSSDKFADHSEDIQSKQISPDSRRTEKRIIKISESAGTRNKRNRLT